MRGELFSEKQKGLDNGFLRSAVIVSVFIL